MPDRHLCTREQIVSLQMVTLLKLVNWVTVTSEPVLYLICWLISVSVFPFTLKKNGPDKKLRSYHSYLWIWGLVTCTRIHSLSHVITAVTFEFDQLFCHMRFPPSYVITTPHKSVSIIQIGTARPDTAFLRFSEEGGRKYKNTELCFIHMVDFEHFLNWPDTAFLRF